MIKRTIENKEKNLFKTLIRWKFCFIMLVEVTFGSLSLSENCT